MSLSVFVFKASISAEIWLISARSTLFSSSCFVAKVLVSISGFVSSACKRRKISESSKVAPSTWIFLLAYRTRRLEVSIAVHMINNGLPAIIMLLIGLVGMEV